MDKPNVVMFWFMDDWARFGRTYEQVARQLARQQEVGQVLCVLAPDRAAPTDLRPPLRVREWSHKLVAVTPQPHVVPASGPPYRLRRWLNGTLPALALRALLRSRGFNAGNTLLWLFPPHPMADELSAKVPHRYQITHVIDNNTLRDQSPEPAREFAHEQYARLPATSDRVYVNSALNLELFGRTHARVSMFENAVDPAFLGTPRLPRPNPVLAYLGFVSERTDLSLVQHLADHRADWQIRVAAPDRNDARTRLAPLLQRPNAQWVRDLPATAAPAFLRDADVCLMPHHDSPYSRSMSPLKLFQYLASGRPVVTTPVAGVERFSALVRVASGPEAFAAAVDAALAQDTLDAASRRIAAMSGETWASRVDAMLQPVLSDWYGPAGVPARTTGT